MKKDLLSSTYSSMLGSLHLCTFFTPVPSVTRRGSKFGDMLLVSLVWRFLFRAIISGDSKSRRSARSANPRSTVGSALVVYCARSSALGDLWAFSGSGAWHKHTIADHLDPQGLAHL